MMLRKLYEGVYVGLEIPVHISYRSLVFRLDVCMYFLRLLLIIHHPCKNKIKLAAAVEGKLCLYTFKLLKLHQPFITNLLFNVKVLAAAVEYKLCLYQP